MGNNGEEDNEKRSYGTIVYLLKKAVKGRNLSVGNEMVRNSYIAHIIHVVYNMAMRYDQGKYYKAGRCYLEK